MNTHIQVCEVCVCTSVWPVHTGAPLLLSLSALSQPSLYFCRMSPTALKCLFLSLPTQPIFFLSPFHPPTPSLSFSLTSGSRPQNGSMILYNRKKVKYRKDGYCWKKRKDGKTTREDHMKLKVQGVEVRPFVRAVKHTNPSSCFEIVGVQIMGTLKKRSPRFSSCCTRSASPQVDSNFF